MSGKTAAVWPWNILGLAQQPEDPKDVRRAYGRKLKEMDPENDVEGFNTLRQAYKAARQICEGRNEGRVNITSRNRVQRLQESAPAPHFPTVRALQNGPRETSPPATTVEAPAQPAPDPMDDLEQVTQKALAFINNSTYSPDIWRPLITAPALDQPTNARFFEQRIVFSFLDALRDTKTIKFNKGFAELVDQRFGWSSDGIGFLKRYPGGHALLEALIEKPSLLKRWSGQRVKDIRGRSIPFEAWYGLVICWLLIRSFLT